MFVGCASPEGDDRGLLGPGCRGQAHGAMCGRTPARDGRPVGGAPQR